MPWLSLPDCFGPVYGSHRDGDAATMTNAAETTSVRETVSSATTAVRWAARAVTSESAGAVGEDVDGGWGDGRNVGSSG
jgi:hypothetical protein